MASIGCATCPMRQYQFDYARTLVSDLFLEREVTQVGTEGAQPTQDSRENRKIVFLGTPREGGSQVVPRASAVVPGVADGEPIATHTDHTNVVKFESRSNFRCKKLSGHLRMMAARAGDMIGGCKHISECSGNNKMFLVQSSVLEVSHVDHFVGWSEELDAIHRELQHNGSRKTVAVHGLGGIGKTQRHNIEYLTVLLVSTKDVGTLKRGAFTVTIRRWCS
ncbi:hypothetical protein BKA63DRAFT_560677 [Paraphoma chrysanthemicola]|nr:hypothetical protein BKA63DRAFT_560677 [Paraphoma chrysanthemicola]